MYKFRLNLFAFVFVIMPAFSQMINGDFESGRNAGWTEYSQGNYTLIAPGANFLSSSIEPPVYPHSGTWMARIGGFAYEVNYIAQTFALPDTKPLYLSFFVQTRSANTSECAGLWVGAKTSIIINSQLISSSYLCRYNDLHQWTQYFVDLTAIAGQTAQVIFAAEAANSVWSYLYLDDISLTFSTDLPNDTQQINGIELDLIYPNPCADISNFRYQLSEEQFVSVKIYDCIGREIETLVEEQLAPGIYHVSWNAVNCRSGLYFCRLFAGGKIINRKIVLSK